MLNWLITLFLASSRGSRWTRSWNSTKAVHSKSNKRKNNKNKQSRFDFRSPFPPSTSVHSKQPFRQTNECHHRKKHFYSSNQIGSLTFLYNLVQSQRKSTLYTLNYCVYLNDKSRPHVMKLCSRSLHSNTLNNSDSVLVYPPTLTVSRDQGPAGEEQSSKMGKYTMSEEEPDNKPVWTNWDGSQKKFYNAGNYVI